MPARGVSHLRRTGDLVTVDTTTEYADPTGESVFRIPRDISMREWFRLASLEHYRGRLTDRQVEVLKYASLEADPRTGRIVDVPRWMATYGAAIGVGQTLAYRYRAELIELGWIRKVQGTSYGVTAVYELQLPARLLPQGHLPEDLLPTVLHDPEPDHADTTYGHLTSRPCVPLTLVPPAPLGEPEPNPFHDVPDADAPGYEPDPDVLQDAAPEAAPDTVIPWADLLGSPDLCAVEVCPYYARASYHLDLESDVSRGASHTNRTNGKRRGSPEPVTTTESATAAAVLAACRSAWLRQRGPNGGLTAAEAAALQPVVVLALRRTTANDLIDRLSAQVRSAR
ncbi:MAG: hypothetical protein HOV68_33755, partial [Streptomycetaceae bacterium]|nr:hypothetical protein [Streptomycetaceae bacterium]